MQQLSSQQVSEFVEAWSRATLSLQAIGRQFGLNEKQCQAAADKLRAQGVPLARRRH